MEHKDQTFSNTSEVIDDNGYINCQFKNCLMLYRGGQLPAITGCSFDDCRWEFEEGAMRTLMLLRNLYHGMGIGGQQMVEQTLNSIRIPPEN